MFFCLASALPEIWASEYLLKSHLSKEYYHAGMNLPLQLTFNFSYKGSLSLILTIIVQSISVPL